MLFDQPNGVELETEGGIFVYPIPPDGVLKVTNKGYSGMVNLSYFYVDSDGRRSKIDSMQITGDRSITGLPQNKFGKISQDDYDSRVYIMNAGGLGSFNTKSGVVQFSRFIVATPRQAEEENIYDQMELKTSQIQREITSLANSPSR
jgi:hypothetical protein